MPSKEWVVASVNVDRLTPSRWEELVRNLVRLDVDMCAIQHHAQTTMADHDQTEYGLWLNPPVTTASAGVSGGVAWAIRKAAVCRVARVDGPGEGPHAMWVRTQNMEGKPINWASVYIRPGSAHAKD